MIRTHYADQLIRELDKQLYLISNSDEVGEIYKSFLGVDSATAKQLLSKISFGLPEMIIRVQPNTVSKQIQAEIIDHFILFMVQERSSHHESFGQTFSEFIQLLVDNLARRNLTHVPDQPWAH